MGVAKENKNLKKGILVTLNDKTYLLKTTMEGEKLNTKQLASIKDINEQTTSGYDQDTS